MDQEARGRVLCDSRGGEWGSLENRNLTSKRHQSGGGSILIRLQKGPNSKTESHQKSKKDFY